MTRSPAAQGEVQPEENAGGRLFHSHRVTLIGLE
jgi:hypothetical protein